MVTAAKNSTTLKSPHRSALATRNSPTQTHLCRNNSTARWNRARYYHAELGRFISRDPIGYVDGMNLYRAYFVPSGFDPSGAVCIACTCKQFPGPFGPGQLPASTTSTIKTECNNSTSSNCCRRACGGLNPPGSFVSWRACNAIPDTKSPIESSCPPDWRNTSNMLDCVGCCLKGIQVATIVESGVECYAIARPLKPLRPNGTINVIGSSARRWRLSWTVNSTEHCLTKTYLKCGIPRDTISCVNRYCVYYTIAEGVIDWGRIVYCTEACRRKFAS